MGFLKSLFSGFNKPQYGTPSITLTGVKVKSKAEKTIADYLTTHNIKYKYEKTARSHNLFSSKKVATPDFYLPQYKVYIEYWGLVDADDRNTRETYSKMMKFKMAIYHKNKIKFISVFPSNLGDLDYTFRRQLLDLTGKEFVF